MKIETNLIGRTGIANFGYASKTLTPVKIVGAFVDTAKHTQVTLLVEITEAVAGRQVGQLQTVWAEYCVLNGAQ